LRFIIYYISCFFIDAGRVTKEMQAKRRQNAMIDTDGDGKFDENEKAALRDQLGDRTVSVLDVPTHILQK